MDVLGEIVRSFYNHGEIPRVYWWRTSNGEEVDFIMEREGRLVPIEVKITSRSESGLVKTLESFCRLFDKEVDRAMLINLSPEKLRIGKKISIVPFKDFLLEIMKGKQH